MPEPTVPVPVSLIERTAAEYERDGWPLAAEKWRALLSQPTPTAEPKYTKASAAPKRLRVRGDGFVTSPADPPSITNMAPGTRFRTDDDTWTVMDSFGDRWLQKGDGDAWDIEDLDPSTIRDVTPPPT